MTLDALFDAAWNRRDRTALPALQDWLDESVVDHDPDAVARACLGTARLLLLDREYGVAGELVDRGIAAGPRDELTRLRLLNLRAYCFLELGSIAEAVEPLLVVERTAGEHVAEGRQAQINLALALLDLGDVAGAREGFERLATAPGARTWDVAFARYGQGRCLAREGRFDDVERLVTALRALRVEDRRLLAHEDLLTAMVADGRGRWAEVHPSALRAQLALGDDAGVEALECLVLRSRAHRCAGQPAAARPLVDEALRRAPPGRHRARCSARRRWSKGPWATRARPSWRGRRRSTASRPPSRAPGGRCGPARSGRAPTSPGSASSSCLPRTRRCSGPTAPWRSGSPSAPGTSRWRSGSGGRPRRGPCRPAAPRASSSLG